MSKARNVARSIWIFSNDVFFIQGVKSLSADVFNSKKCIFHVFNERQIINMVSVDDIRGKALVFSDTVNPLLSRYLELCCNGNVISGRCSIEKARRYFMTGKVKKNKKTCGAYCLREKWILLKA